MSASPDQHLLDIIGFLQFLFISTIGANDQLHPIADASTPDTLPISYAYFLSFVEPIFTSYPTYVPSTQAPLPPASVLAAINRGILEFS